MPEKHLQSAPDVRIDGVGPQHEAAGSTLGHQHEFDVGTEHDRRLEFECLELGPGPESAAAIGSQNNTRSIPATVTTPGHETEPGTE